MFIRFDLLSFFSSIDNQPVHGPILIPPTFNGLLGFFHWLTLLLGSSQLTVAYQLILICWMIHRLTNIIPIRFGSARPFRERCSNQRTVLPFHSFKSHRSLQIDVANQTEFNVKRMSFTGSTGKNTRSDFSFRPMGRNSDRKTLLANCDTSEFEVCVRQNYSLSHFSRRRRKYWCRRHHSARLRSDS